MSKADLVDLTQSDSTLAQHQKSDSKRGGELLDDVPSLSLTPSARSIIDDETYEFEIGRGTRLHVELSSIIASRFKNRAGLDKAAVAAFTFLDSTGNPLTPCGDTPISEALGAFVYLQSSIGEPGTTAVDLRIPSGAVRVQVRLKRWRPAIETQLVTAPSITLLDATPAEATQGGGVPTRPESGHQFIDDETYEFEIGRGTRLHIELSSIIASRFKNRAGLDKAAVAAFTFLDSTGNPLTPCGDTPISEALGAFIYLQSSIGEPGTTAVDLRIPSGAVRVQVRLKRWRPAIETQLVTAPSITLLDDPDPLEAGEEHSPSTGREPIHPLINDEIYEFEIALATRLRVELSSMVDDRFKDLHGLEKAALVAFTFFNAEGDRLIPYDDTYISDVLGSFVYLQSSIGEPGTTAVELRIPSGAVRLQVRLKRWQQGIETQLVSGPTVEFLDDVADAHSFILDVMQKTIRASNADLPLIIIYSTAPSMSHNSLGLRPNRLAKEYGALGYTVAFFPFSRIQNEDVVFSSKIVQFSRDLLPIFMAEAAAQNKNCVFVCSSFPDIQAAAAIDLAKSLGWPTLYEVRDDMEEFNRVGYSVWYHPRLEMYVARRSDAVTAVSPRLADKMILLGARKERVHIIPNGIDETFVQSATPLREGRISRRCPRTVGYIGHLTPAWFDWSLVLNTARRNPDIQFEIVGHGAPEKLDLPDNMRLLGPKTHEEFMELSREWSVGIIPFKPSRLTAAVDPNKLYEYLAVGLRVVSAEMGSVTESPFTSVYRERNDFEGLLRLALDKVATAEEMTEVEKYLEQAVWSKKADRTLAVVGI